VNPWIARLLIPLLTVFATWPLALGRMPLTQDHPVHLHKAWFYWTELLGSGQLRGWSDYWFFGYPAGDLYPPGTDLWVALFRALTLGVLSWEATYALALAGAFGFVGAGVYAFLKRPLGAPAALIACALWLLDPGAFRQGGWSYFLYWGVWGQPLAMGFLLFGLARLGDYLEDGRGRQAAAGAAWLGAGLVVHPTNLVLMGFIVPLWLGCRALIGGADWKRDLRRAALVGGVGLLLSAWWLFPMTQRSDWTVNIGEPWAPLGELSGRLLTGGLFTNTSRWVSLAAAIGFGLAIARRQALAVSMGALWIALLVFTTEQCAGFLSAHLSESFSYLQYERLTLGMKLGLFALAGYAGVTLWGMAKALTGAGRPLAMAGAAALVGVGAASGVLAKSDMPVTMTTTADTEWWRDFQAYTRWALEEHGKVDDFYRVALEETTHSHRLMAAPIHDGVPIYKAGYTPAKLFKHAPEMIHPRIYQRLSMRYVVKLDEVPRELLRKRKLTPLQRFGRYHVYRYGPWRPARAHLEGEGGEEVAGRVEVLAFERESVRIRLSGVEPGARLVLHRAEYVRWSATAGGEEVAITPVKVHAQGQPMLMSVPARDGEVVFSYGWRAEEWIGLVMTLLGGLISLRVSMSGHRVAERS